MRYNTETKKLEEEGKAKKGEKRAYTPMVRIEGDMLNKLVEYAKADGIVLTRKAKNGKIVNDNGKLAQVVRLYAKAALQDFISNRESQ